MFTKKPFFPQSIQSDLFNMLDADQQPMMRNILRVIKKPAQEDLCCALLDYLEGLDNTPPAEPTLAAIYNYIISQWNPLH